MRRYISLLSPVLSMLWVGYALAQTMAEAIETPSTSTADWFLKILLTAVTLGGSAATPYLTKYLTMWILIGIGKAKVNIPAPLLVFISTVISGVFSGVMGTVTELPLHGDSAALVGSIVGGGTQHFANNAPVKPNPEAMAKVVAQKDTAIV